eukprot:TRINITY_DN115388_c0_g1_i1.p1 TRINITY_DN115388_c0_g1~~TRINITY_DN115388_c0_g1_i1.p1  ORF type:complete len:447 (+),score=31.07 TRINITY_DN115388_c0_g1_i1:43-1341(+)
MDDALDYLDFGDGDDALPEPTPAASGARGSTEHRVVNVGPLQDVVRIAPLQRSHQPMLIKTELLATESLRALQKKVHARTADLELDDPNRLSRLRPGKRRRDRIKAMLSNLNGCASTELLGANRRTVVYYCSVNVGMPWKVKARGVPLDKAAAPFADVGGKLPYSRRVDCMVLPWEASFVCSRMDCLAVALNHESACHADFLSLNCTRDLLPSRAPCAPLASHLSGHAGSSSSAAAGYTAGVNLSDCLMVYPYIQYPRIAAPLPVGPVAREQDSNDNEGGRDTNLPAVAASPAHLDTAALALQDALKEHDDIDAGDQTFNSDVGASIASPDTVVSVLSEAWKEDNYEDAADLNSQTDAGACPGTAVSVLLVTQEDEQWWWKEDSDDDASDRDSHTGIVGFVAVSPPNTAEPALQAQPHDDGEDQSGWRTVSL